MVPERTVFALEKKGPVGGGSGTIVRHWLVQPSEAVSPLHELQGSTRSGVLLPVAVAATASGRSARRPMGEQSVLRGARCRVAGRRAGLGGHQGRGG